MYASDDDQNNEEEQKVEEHSDGNDDNDHDEDNNIETKEEDEEEEKSEKIHSMKDAALETAAKKRAPCNKPIQRRRIMCAPPVKISTCHDIGYTTALTQFVIKPVYVVFSF